MQVRQHAVGSTKLRRSRACRPPTHHCSQDKATACLFPYTSRTCSRRPHLSSTLKSSIMPLATQVLQISGGEAPCS